MPLVPCPGCRRHLKADETACPFCRAALPKALAAGLTALALVGCPPSAPTPPRLQSGETTAPAPAYGGAPPAPVVTSSAPAPDTDDEPQRDVYGAPPPPPQASTDEPQAPVYGAPPAPLPPGPGPR